MTRLQVETDNATIRAPGLIVLDLAVMALALPIAWVSVFGTPGKTPAAATERIEGSSR